MSEWVEFNAPLDTIQVISEADLNWSRTEKLNSVNIPTCQWQRFVEASCMHKLSCLLLWNIHENTVVISVLVCYLQGGPKKLTPFVLYTLISSNIDRFSNLFHCQNQKKTFVIILSLKIPPHLKYVATLLVKCQCLKSNNWKEDGFCNKHIKKINNRKQRVYSQLLSKVTVTSCSYTVVQMFNVSTLLLYDAVLKLFLQKSSCFQLLLLRHWYFTR